MADPTNAELALEVIKATTAVQDAHDTVVEEGKRLIAHVDDPNAHGRDVDATAEAAAKAAVDTHDATEAPHAGKFAAAGHDHQAIAGNAATASLATLAETATLADTATRAESAAMADAVPWAGVTDKPADYQPAAHVHTFAELTDKPEHFQPVAHGHGWDEVSGKPGSFPPETHNHDGTYAAEGHGHSSITGNAATATKLQTARTISLTGDVTGSASFNGAGNVSISAKLKTGVAPSNGMAFYMAAGFPAAPTVTK